MGRFFEDDITPEMHNAIVWIASWAGRDLDPEASAPFYDIAELPSICGHRDVNNTTCPGQEFYDTLDLVRTEARRVIRGRDDPEPPPPQWHPGMRVITNAEGTTLRKGPGLDFEEVSKVSLGERLVVLQGPATNDGMIWYEVEGPSLSGWIAGNLLIPDPDTSPPEIPTVEEPDSTPPVEEGGTPPPEAPAETPVDVEPDPEEDAAVGGGDDGGGGGRKDRRQEAWPTFEAGTVAVVIGGALNLRAEPGLWAEVLTEMPDGYMVTVIGGPVDGDGIAWYQLMTPDNLEGWSDGTYLQPV
jgi:uncharacterized protein YgiM (DUF1202 family)